VIQIRSLEAAAVFPQPNSDLSVTSLGGSVERKCTELLPHIRLNGITELADGIYWHGITPHSTGTVYEKKDLSPRE
jgi:hypothetical protein